MLDAQQLPRIGLQHFRPDLVADLEFGEVRHPAVGRDHRPVRSEQHLVLQNAVDVAHQDRRGIFWRPAGEGGGARMIFKSGKSAATSSTYIGLEYFSRIPMPPGMPLPTPVCPVWNK